MEQTSHNYDSLKETSILGFDSIFKIVGIKKILFSDWINLSPILCAILIISFSYFLNIDFYVTVVEIKNIMIDFLPGILGFTVAGYSFMIGLIHVGMLNKITEPISETNNFSLYQKTSATFAANIIIQSLSLVFAYFFHIFIFFDEKKNVKINLSDFYLSLINLVALVIISYLFVISLLMILQVIINIFNFSQLHHYFVNKEKIENNKT